MDSTNVPSGVAVSGLMQQLKSGEISKMQLFQQIALLQAATSTGNTPTSTTAPPPASMAAAAMLGMAKMQQPPLPSTPTMHFGAPRAPASVMQSKFNQTNTQAPASVHPTQYQPQQQLLPQPEPLVRMGAQPLESNTEVLTSGVSHDNAQRLSVQEWMASKTRSLAPPMTQPSTARPESYLQQVPHTSVPATPTSMLFSLLQQPQPEPLSNPSPGFFSTPPQSHPPTRSPNLDQRQFMYQAPNNNHQEQLDTTPYMYKPQWQQQQPSQSQYMDPRYDEEQTPVSREEVQPQEYLTYDQHPFHDELGRNDGNGGPKGSGNGTGVGVNGGGDGGINGGGEDKFHARVTRWKSQKEAIREQLKQQLLQSELDECTFTPKVNPKSTKVITRLRKNMVAGMVHGEIPSDAQQLSLVGSVSERLYQEADNYKAREELAAKLRAEDEAELQRECTFKPKINKGNPITDKVRPKYMTIPKKDTPVITPAAMEAAAKELEECTFNPKVNAINPEMVSAQLYLQQNIYDRLSRPCGVPNGSQSVGRSQRSLFGDDSESDMTDTLALVSPNSRRCQDDLYVRARRRRSSQQSQQQPLSCDRPRPRSAGGMATLEEKAERAQQFENFLERQRFHEQSRKKKMEMTLQQLVHPHRPSINKKSLMMMENGRKGDFLERITKYAIQKEHDTVKKKTVRVSDPQCTFKPSINNHSAKRQGRSVTELSRGDLLRRETTQRLMKLRMEQEEMTALTFRPQLNRVSQRVEGRLNILTSPDTYLQRIQQQRQAHTIKQRRAVQEKEMEEFAECTFKPRTIEAPAYVQRIAKSVSLNKAIKKQQEATVKLGLKPEWK